MSKLSIVKFSAEWCGPCKQMAPYWQELKEEYQGLVEFKDIDVDKQPKLASQMDIRSIPTTLFIKDKNVLEMLVGGVSKAKLIKLIEELR